MKKIILLILALIAIIPGVVWLKSRIAHPPQDNEKLSGFVRLLALPPSNIELSTPLWDYRSEIKSGWQTRPLPGDWVAYRWSGFLDIDRDTPSIEVLSGTQRLPSLGTEDQATAGYRFTRGHEAFQIPTLTLPPPHQPILSFEVPILSASSLLVFEARKERVDPPQLNLSLASTWTTTLSIDTPDWKQYSLAPQGVAAGTQTLVLDGTRDGVPAFFIRNFRIAEPSTIEVFLKREDPPPCFRYRPANPVAELLRSDQNLPSNAPVRSPWAVYDEDERWIRSVEIGSIVRSALFLPTPSSVRFDFQAEPGSELVFYPVIQNPAQLQASGQARLRVFVEGQSETPVFDRVIESIGDAAAKAWDSGFRIVLPAGVNGKCTLRFESAANGAHQPPQPLFLGEPLIFPPQKEGKPQPPDIILISIDTLRADALSCLGYERQTSPWMERFFGRDGVCFSHVQAPCTWTLPSHASLFLSQYVSRHGVGSEDVRISNEVQMLAELFSEKGYQTAAFVDRGFIEAHYGFGQGFQRYDQLGGHFATSLPRCRDWLADRNRSVPTFLFLHTYDCHGPYNSPEPYHSRFVTPELRNLHVANDCPEPAGLQAANMAEENGSRVLNPACAPYWRALYDGGVLYVDHKLEDWFKSLENSGLVKDPLVILLSDHGESFYEHGSWAHGWNVYEELARVPVLIRFPKKAHAGTKVSSRVSLLDVAPTLYEYLGWQAPEEWQGHSLLPLIRGETPAAPRNLYTELSREAFVFSAVYLKDRKVIETRKATQKPVQAPYPREELYDLAADPGETRNLAPENIPEVSREIQRLRTVREFMRQERSGESSLENVQLDAEDIKELQGLGYLH
ncbi:MAG: hypothetical protein AMXMBFR75_33270 [Candidatus Hinthialibacteria bacterium]